MSRFLQYVTMVACILGIQDTGAGEIKHGEKFLWSCYMICFPVSGNFHGYKDRPLDRPPVDKANVRLIDLINATRAGVDALSIDLFIQDKGAIPAFQQLVKLINTHHLPIQISPMFDGLGSPGVSLDDTIAKIQKWFQLFAKEDCVVRYEGKPVMFTYGASSLKPDQWHTVLDRLHAAGCDGYWIPELEHLLNHSTPPILEAADQWLKMFPSANVFLVHNPTRVQELIRKYQAAYPKPVHQWVGDVAIGYWRPEIAVYTSQRGTKQFRDNWRVCRESGINWIQQSTWNDFSENHHIMPSENYGSVFCELNRWLAAEWKGKSEALPTSKLYVSQQQEIQAGEEAQFEVLTLLREEDLPAKVMLELADATGVVVKRFEQDEITKPGLQVAEICFPVNSVPIGRLLMPSASLWCRGQTLKTLRAPYSIVCPGGYRPERNYSWLHSSADAQIKESSCILSLNKSNGEFVITADADVALADVEVLRDGVQLRSLRREGAAQLLNRPMRWAGKVDLNRNAVLPPGAYAARIVTADGRTATSLPVFVDRPADADAVVGMWNFDHDRDGDILDNSSWLHDGRLGGRPKVQSWRPEYVDDPWGGKCLNFDGLDDRVLIDGAIVPPDSFTIECWINPSGAFCSSGQIIFATANAAVVLGLSANGNIQVSRKGTEGWRRVVDKVAVSAKRWQHVAASYDGRHLRLYRNGILIGETQVSGQGRCGEVSIGYNSVTGGSFYSGQLDEVRLSPRALQPQEFGPHNPNACIPPLKSSP